MNRPIRVPDPFRSEEDEPDLVRASRRRWLVPALGAGAALILVLALVGLAIARSQSARLEREVRAWQAEVAALQARQPTCHSYAAEIEALHRLLQQGEFALAERMANLHLTNVERPACPDARLALASLAYTAALKDLTSTPGLDGHTAVLRWQEAERRAEANGVPKADREPPISVVVEAYNAGLWELARVAFLKAWDEGTADRQALKQVRLYYASCGTEAGRWPPTATRRLASRGLSSCAPHAKSPGPIACPRMRPARTWRRRWVLR